MAKFNWFHISKINKPKSMWIEGIDGHSESMVTVAVLKNNQLQRYVWIIN